MPGEYEDEEDTCEHVPGIKLDTTGEGKYADEDDGTDDEEDGLDEGRISATVLFFFRGEKVPDRDSVSIARPIKGFAEGSHSFAPRPLSHGSWSLQCTAMMDPSSEYPQSTEDGVRENETVRGEYLYVLLEFFRFNVVGNDSVALLFLPFLPE